MWGVVYSKACMEVGTAARVAAKGLPVYVPQYHDRELRRRRVLFPRYFFVDTAPGEASLYGVKGLCRLLWPQGAAALERLARVIVWLRSCEMDGLFVMRELLVEGASVRIVSGAFEGRLAIFAGQLPHERVAVLLELLGGERRIILERRAVVPARA